MNPVTRFLRRLVSDKAFRDFGETQSLALLDGLMAVVHSDGETTAEEGAVLRRELLKLPWAWEHTTDELDRYVEQSSQRIEQLHRKEVSPEFARKLAAELQGQEVRDLVYHMMVGIVYADEPRDSEMQALEAFRDAFGLSKERAQLAVRDVKEQMAGDLI